MLLPLPTIIGWFLALAKEGKFLELSLERLQQLAPCIGVSFLALALTAVAFLRLGQRWLRVSLLFVSGFLTLTLVAYDSEGKLNLPTIAVLMVIMLGLLLCPALLERRLRCGRQRLMTYPSLWQGLTDAKSSHPN